MLLNLCNYWPKFYVNLQAAILVTVGYSYIGAQGDINIWNPKVESPDEFTTAQIWLKNGPGDAFESVESGWVVSFEASFVNE